MAVGRDRGAAGRRRGPPARAAGRAHHRVRDRRRVLQRRRVDLVDLGGYYRTPELDCEQADVVILRDLPVEVPGATNIIVAARSALDPHLTGGTEADGIGPIRGYQSQRLGDATTDPVVQVTRDGTVVAFAHVRGRGGCRGPAVDGGEQGRGVRFDRGHPAADRDVHDDRAGSLISGVPRPRTGIGARSAVDGLDARRRTWRGCRGA